MFRTELVPDGMRRGVRAAGGVVERGAAAVRAGAAAAAAASLAEVRER